jgi:hypothetical protein
MNEEATSLIQGVINEMDQATTHKQRAIDLLDDLKAWLIQSLQRDYAFRDRMLRATTVEQGAVLMESDIRSIASTFGAGDGKAKEVQGP